MAEATITVRVIPRSGRAGPAGLRNDAYLIRLNAPPVEGAANAELIDLLASLLHVPKRNVSIVAGDRARVKRLRIAGVSEQQVRDRLLP